ncbi:hypothetical protein CEXT_366591 [Caerostris extrusa]|uniref:Uncharacterized protein n=1 Tax=Caerostris extrusa TaxID=172846 RepID=A0AAV4YGJ7_CAEEX|nr:hypothetical protein CEXT_366591 [Caerostris extrusa]
MKNCSISLKHCMLDRNSMNPLTFTKKVLHERIDIFGSDNPSVLDIQTRMAQVLHAQQKYDKALCMFQQICQKRQISFSDNHEVLLIKSHIASILSIQGDNKGALQILRQVLLKQEQSLEPNNEHILFTQETIAFVLEKEKNTVRL